MAPRLLSFFAIAVCVVATSCGRSAAAPRPPQNSVQQCAATGTFHGRSIDVDGTQRFFLLHVPSSYVCGVPMPLLVDFHGTTSLLTPEEDLVTEEAIALAEARGFILARPRSLVGPVDGDDLFQWDVNDGDLDRNAAFTIALVGQLHSEYDIDARRTYALGFSNGTNMVSRMIAEPGQPFRGYAMIGGGAWAETDIPPAAGGARPRLYAATGYRDYMHEWHKTLMQKWVSGGYPMDAVFSRAHHGGHELYDWHYVEAWDWLDRGVRPDRGQLNAEWSVIPLESGEDLLSVGRTPTGLIVSGANGFLAVEESGGWAYPLAREPSSEPITDVCVRADGVGIAVGDRRYAYTRDAGRSWVVDAAPPEFFGSYLGDSHLLGAACGDRLIAGGYWTGVVADQPHGPWEGSSMLDSDEVPEHTSDLIVADDGNVIAVGENWIGRSKTRDWTEFELVDEPTGWMYGITAAGEGRFWVVGDRGQLRRSTDDGWSWETVRERHTGPDLFAVHFADAAHGAAVGAGGVVYATHNGGLDWFSIPTGLDHYLGGVIAYEDGSVVVAGEGGFLARWHPSGPVQ